MLVICVCMYVRTYECMSKPKVLPASQPASQPTRQPASQPANLGHCVLYKGNHAFSSIWCGIRPGLSKTDPFQHRVLQQVKGNIVFWGLPALTLGEDTSSHRFALNLRNMYENGVPALLLVGESQGKPLEINIIGSAGLPHAVLVLPLGFLSCSWMLLVAPGRSCCFWSKPKV